MSLTPEDRKRIYEEEKARLEAQEQLKREQGIKAAAESTKQKTGRRNGCLIVLGIIAALWAIGSMSSHNSTSNTSTSTSTSTSTTSTASSDSTKHLTIRLTKYEYNREANWIEVEGVVLNDGQAEVFSPTIIGEAFSKSGTLLGQDKTWPAGQFLSRMAPGTSAGFHMLIPVQGGVPANGQVYTKDAPYNTVYPK